MVNRKNWISEEYATGLVSVLIPTYNRASLLHEAIQSVIAQSYRPVECIVVDDGSSENISAVVEQYAVKEIEGLAIKYLYQANAGSQVARNTGTRASTGEYIQYLDSDDLLYTDKLQFQVAFLEHNKNYDAVFGNWFAGDKENKVFVQAYAGEDMIDQMLTERCIANFSFLMRRSLVQKIGPWDISIRRNQEIDFHLRGLMEGANYAHLNYETGLLRTHQGERISTITSTCDLIDFYQKWQNILVEKKMLGKDLKRKIAAIYFWYFYTDINYGTLSLRLLTAARELDPNNELFRSKRFKFLTAVSGKKMALKFWLRWLIYNRTKQQAVKNQ